VGFLVYKLVSSWLNDLLRPTIMVFGLNEDICVLEGWHVCVFFLSLLSLTMVSSFASSLAGMYSNENGSGESFL
jgi:hypothetical protein